MVASQQSFQSAVLVTSATLVQAVSKAPGTRPLAHCLCSEPLRHHRLLPKVQSSLSLALQPFAISYAACEATAVR